MTDVRKVPLRSTFIQTAVSKCWRKAKLEVERPPDKLPHYFLGGQMFAIMCEQHFNAGGLGMVDPMEAAATAYLIAMSESSYSCTDEQRATLVSRCAEGFAEFLQWMHETKLRVIGSEVEVRSTTNGGRDIAIKIDLLCVIGDKLYLLDIKTFGMWGKSITASNVTEQQLRQSVQLATYAYVLERGGKMYVGGNIGRTETNDEVASRLTPLLGKVKPDYVGYISIALLTRRRRNSKFGRAGDRRGNPLVVIEYDNSMSEYAEEVIRMVELAITFDQFPRTQRFEKGYSTCMGCPFEKDCWSGRAAPQSPPSWLASKNTGEEK